MNKNILITLFLVVGCLICVEGKKTYKRPGSGSGSRSPPRGKTSNPKPSFPKPRPKPSKPPLSRSQEKPGQRKTQTPSRQSNSTGSKTNSYPPSQTGMSGGNNPQPKPAPSSQAQQPSSGQGSPPAKGISASGAAPPSYSVAGGTQVSYPSSSVGPPPYQGSGYKPGGNYGTNSAPQPPNSAPHYGGYVDVGGYGGHGGYGGPEFSGYGSQMPGYFGNRGFGGGSRTSSALEGVGIAGAGVGKLLTGLALWNLARSTGHHRHTVIYDHIGQPVAVAPNKSTKPVVDPILGDLVNCTLTISSTNATEVLGIPCAIATSFTPEADVKENTKDANADDNTKCIVTVVTKTGKEFMTTIPCSILLRTAAENNVTEPPEVPHNGTDIANESVSVANKPSALMLSGDAYDRNNGGLNCTVESGDVRDPINPCFSVVQNLTVIPLHPTMPSDLVNSTYAA